MTQRVAIGLDLGGTNLKGAVVDSHAHVITRLSIPTDAARGPDFVIAEMVQLTEKLLVDSGLSKANLLGVGVGSPGPLSMRHGVIYHCANLPGWNHVPLRQRLQDKIGCSVVLENDGNAAAFGEYWTRFKTHAHADPNVHGADLVMLTLGTGVGAGVILEGKVLHGHFENAAELGHTIVSADGLACPCGQRGCLEQYCAASAIARRVTAGIRAGTASTLRDVAMSGREISAHEVADAARAGDALCARIWDEASLYLAIACINIQHAFNPERVVLGGGLAQAGEFLLQSVTRHFENRRWMLCRDFPAISISILGSDAGAIGAAGLIWVQA